METNKLTCKCGGDTFYIPTYVGKTEFNHPDWASPVIHVKCLKCHLKLKTRLKIFKYICYLVAATSIKEAIWIFGLTKKSERNNLNVDPPHVPENIVTALLNRPMEVIYKDVFNENPENTYRWFDLKNHVIRTLPLCNQSPDIFEKVEG